MEFLVNGKRITRLPFYTFSVSENLIVQSAGLEWLKPRMKLRDLVISTSTESTVPLFNCALPSECMNSHFASTL